MNRTFKRPQDKSDSIGYDAIAALAAIIAYLVQLLIVSGTQQMQIRRRLVSKLAFC